MTILARRSARPPQLSGHHVNLGRDAIQLAAVVCSGRLPAADRVRECGESAVWRAGRRGRARSRCACQWGRAAVGCSGSC